MCANAGVSGTIKPFHDLILAWQPSLAPGLPAYVNPRIARQPQNMRNVLHLRLDRLHRVLLIILAMPALPGGGRVSSVGLRDTVPKASHRFMSHSKSFAPALHPYSFLSRQAGLLQSVKHFTKHGASKVNIDSAVAHAEVALLASRECPRQPQGPSLLSSLLAGTILSFVILTTLILW